MSVLGLVGTAVGGLIGWNDDQQPAADPDSVRELLEDLGLPRGCDDAQVTAALRAFQAHVGLHDDGVAGPATVHQLVRYAKTARELAALDPAA